RRAAHSTKYSVQSTYEHDRPSPIPNLRSARGLIRQPMSISSIAIADSRSAVLCRLYDYVELTKPRIAILELLVVVAAGVVATWGQPDPWLMVHAMLGTLLVASSASAANQWLERHQDARMARTASRPLPAGRLTSSEAIVF